MATPIEKQTRSASSDNGKDSATKVDLSLLEPVLESYAKEKGSLIPALQAAQEIYGYLPETVMERIAGSLRVPLSSIYGVVTFYSQFYLTPRGKHVLRVCRGTACHVRGGKSILNAVKNTLGIDDGETTGDGKFTFETVACLGCCALAPVLVVNKSYYGKMTPRKAETLLTRLP